MNKYQPPRRFTDKSTKAARETIERGVSAAQVAEQSFSWSLAAMRELNGKLIDMAHANADAVFDLASEVAGAKGPSDWVVIWSEYTRRQFEMMSDQTLELTELGQKFATEATPKICSGQVAQQRRSARDRSQRSEAVGAIAKAVNAKFA